MDCLVATLQPGPVAGDVCGAQHHRNELLA